MHHPTTDAEYVLQSEHTTMPNLPVLPRNLGQLTECGHHARKGSPVQGAHGNEGQRLRGNFSDRTHCLVPTEIGQSIQSCVTPAVSMSTNGEDALPALHQYKPRIHSNRTQRSSRILSWRESSIGTSSVADAPVSLKISRQPSDFPNDLSSSRSPRAAP